MPGTCKIIISNLNGSLLENDSRLAEAASPAWKAIQEREVPVVFCSSRTFDETVALQQSLGISSPFIVENGGAIYFQKGYFATVDSPCETRGNYQRISLGLPYSQVVLFLALIKKLVPAPIVGFSDMSAKELAAESGLSLETARRARRREFDEPFKVVKNAKTVLSRIERTVKGSEVNVTTGGRFFHLAGGGGAGRAVALVRKLYQDCYGPVSVAGVGTMGSDLRMLESVDRPWIAAAADGSHNSGLVRRFPGARKAKGAGPGSWGEAVTGMLEEWDRPHER